MRGLRIAAVPYLNLRPFLCALQHVVKCEVIRAHPSELRRIWERETLDLALLPVADFQRLRVQPLDGASISSRGAVRSVFLETNRPVASCQLLALDSHSTTSNILVRVLLREIFEISPMARAFEDPLQALHHHRVDAALLIGDRALRMTRGARRLDLGQLWAEWSSLPFVYAAWVRGRTTKLSRNVLSEALDEARSRSRQFVASEAQRFASRFGLNRGEIESYLLRNISYEFGPLERQGLEMFWHHADRLHGTKPRHLRPKAATGRPH